MAITSLTSQRNDSLVTVTAVSDLSGTVYYHWYIDGAYVARTTSPVWTLHLEVGEQVRIDCNDSNSSTYDAVANAPDGYPARRTLWWVRANDSSVVKYLVQQKLGAGSWTSIGTVYQDNDTWGHKLLTPRLDDLGSYTWQVIPVDAAGNQGTALTIGPETIVRVPDAPDYTISFDSGTDKVTFTEAA